jgi:acyl-CoA thioester hydrolase
MRIKIQLPEQFSYYTTIPIRITDLNYGGHVGNDSVLSLIHEARMHFLKHIQYTELQFEGVSLIMGDAAIEFKSELFYGEQLKVYVAVNNISKVSFDMYYKLVKGEEETVIALAKTGMVCYDYTKKKVVSVPVAARIKLQS